MIRPSIPDPPRDRPIDRPRKMLVRREVPLCMWHPSCIPGRGNGIMREIERISTHSVWECCHCGKKCNVPIGMPLGTHECDDVSVKEPAP